MSRDKADRHERSRSDYSERPTYDWREEYRREDEYARKEEQRRKDEYARKEEQRRQGDRRRRQDIYDSRKNSRRGSKRRYAGDEDDRAGGWIAIALLLAIIIVLGLIAFKFFWKGEIPWEAPQYEDSAEFEIDSESEDAARLNVAVLPDYVVTEASPYILIPYPKDNEYEVEFVFRNADTGKQLYTTKRIRPGTVVRVEAINFCKIGKNPILVEVKLFDPKTWDEVESAVGLETVIKREE